MKGEVAVPSPVVLYAVLRLLFFVCRSFETLDMCTQKLMDWNRLIQVALCQHICELLCIPLRRHKIPVNRELECAAFVCKSVRQHIPQITIMSFGPTQ